MFNSASEAVNFLREIDNKNGGTILVLQKIAEGRIEKDLAAKYRAAENFLISFLGGPTLNQTLSTRQQ